MYAFFKASINTFPSFSNVAHKGLSLTKCNNCKMTYICKMTNNKMQKCYAADHPKNVNMFTLPIPHTKFQIKLGNWRTEILENLIRILKKLVKTNFITEGKLEQLFMLKIKFIRRLITVNYIHICIRCEMEFCRMGCQFQSVTGAVITLIVKFDN